MLRLPPFAGLFLLPDATAGGLDVKAATTRLHRLGYAKQRLAIAAAMFLPSTPEWEAKGALALHAWLDAEHAELLYRRIAEMREPPPGPWDVPDLRLEAAFDEVLAAPTTAARLSALYVAARPALEDAITSYLASTNPLADQPSARVLHQIVADETAIVGRWREAVVRALDGSVEAADWDRHTRSWLAHAGGIAGTAGDAGAPPARFQRPYAPAVLPVRDERFHNLFDRSTPADVVYLDVSRPADERNAALMFKRLREMDVPEVIAGIVSERWSSERNAGQRERRWSYYASMLRQMWDEARHAMLGQALLASHGIDWTSLPVNVTFSWKLARYCSPLERHVLLYAIEQSLMPRARGKPYEYRIAREAGDPLSALFHDFDWADEVLHVDIARRCLRPELPGGLDEARRMADALWDRIAEALQRDPMPLEEHPGAVTDWWRRFARAVLGRDVAPVPETDLKDWRPGERGG